MRQGVDVAHVVNALADGLQGECRQRAIGRRAKTGKGLAARKRDKLFYALRS